MPSATKPRYPLFDQYAIEEIALKTGYAERYLLAVKEGAKEANVRFRRLCCRFLRRPEGELFGEEESHA